MKTKGAALAIGACAAMLVASCDSTEPAVDASTPPGARDAGSTRPDGGTHLEDAGAQDADTGDEDAGAPPATFAKLVLHQQSPPSLTHLAANQEAIDALPFDGTTFSIPSRFDIHSATPVSVATLRSELAAYETLELTNLTENWLIIYATPAGPLSDYQTIVDNYANLAQVAGEVGVSGIFFDTEEYLGDTWSESVLGPGEPVADVQAEALDWGRRAMEAMVERWPEVRFLVTLGPWISDTISADPPSTGALGEACVDDGGLIYDIAHANRVMGYFTLGLALGTYGTPAMFLDGAEMYTQRTLADWERSRDWVTMRYPRRSDMVPAEAKALYPTKVEAAQGTYDFPIEYRCKGPTDAGDWQEDIGNALRTSHSIAWAYSERFDWVGTPRSDKRPPPTEWLEATLAGKTAGQAR